MDLVLSQYLDDLVTPLGVLIANNFERVLSWKYIPPLTQNVLRFLNFGVLKMIKKITLLRK